MLPPLTGVAVKVTLPPLQMVLWLAAIVTVGVTTEFTTIVMLVALAVVGEGQAAVEFITMPTISLLARVLLT